MTLPTTNVASFGVPIGQDLVDGFEEDGGKQQRNDKVHRGQERLPERQNAVEVVAECCKRCARCQRHHEKNPSATTNPRLVERARISHDAVKLGGSTFHIAFGVDCISPNTPDALIINVINPTIVAHDAR